MKKIFLLLLITVGTLTGLSQKSDDIVIGKADSLYSGILKEKRSLMVYVPGIRNGRTDAGRRYPVLYLLDGDSHFESVAGMVKQLSEANGNTIVPQMIVVAIPNTDRTRDLTPTHVISDPPMMDSNFSRNSGGGEHFAMFLEKELIPYIDSTYPTQAYRVLIGHSFGGLTVMNIITNHTRLFKSYIAIDPSMWYDRERFLAATEKKLSAQSFDGSALFLGIANTMPDGMTLEKMNRDTTTQTRHIRSIFALDNFIQNQKRNGLRYASHYYPNDDHGSVPLITEYDGLRFIFDWYRFKFTPADFSSPTLDLVKRLKDHYQRVSREFGFTVSPPEDQVNGLGYNALSQKQYEKAAALFRMNVENYPGSGNVYDSYADLLIARKDSTAAIENYRKALSMTQSSETRRKLDQLLGKTVFNPGMDDLKKLVGAYEFESINLIATTSIKDGSLWVSAPGQGTYELVPVSPNVFTLKGVPGYTLKFEMDGEKPVSLTSIQPNGTYVAKWKE